jgi:hypothetical protein
MQEKVDELPSAPFPGDPPAPPAPTVIEKSVPPPTETLQDVLNPPAPPPPVPTVLQAAPAAPAPPPTTKVLTNLVPGCVVKVPDDV